MKNHNLALNQEIFGLNQEEFENHIESSIEAGNFPPVFLYDDKGRFQGVNALPFSQAAIKLLAKLRTQKEETDEHTDS